MKEFKDIDTKKVKELYHRLCWHKNKMEIQTKILRQELEERGEL